MYLFVKFVHLIAAMIYFAMPFTFGRWFRAAARADNPEPMRDTLVRIRFFALYYLNGCAIVLTGTGIWMSVVRGYWDQFHFPWLSVVILAVTMVLINIFLIPLLKTHAQTLELYRPDSDSAANTRIRMAVFSGIHHTLVTIMVALMVWKPF
ncbi:MAG: DUF2269 family protein [Acidobacteriota bacterium]|nr:DUF2269 family protein [Acidobacteriota bacterium]